MKFDILKSGIANILALVNADNGQELTLEQVSISAPAVFADEGGVNPRNTQVVVSAVPGSGFAGSQTLRFTRIDLAGVSEQAVSIQLDDQSTVASIKAAIVDQLALADSEVALSITEMPDFAESNEVVVQLSANEGSYGYIGSVSVTLVAPVVPDVQLSDVLTVTDLNGFEY